MRYIFFFYGEFWKSGMYFTLTVHVICMLDIQQDDMQPYQSNKAMFHKKILIAGT